MLKKLIAISMIMGLSCTLSASARELSLRQRVRVAFDQLHNKVESAEESKSSYEEVIVDTADENVVDDSVLPDEAGVVYTHEEEKVVEEEVAEEKAPEMEVAAKSVEVESPKTADEASDHVRTARVHKDLTIQVHAWDSEVSGYAKIGKDKTAGLDVPAIDFNKHFKHKASKKVPSIKLAYKASKRSSIELNWAKSNQDFTLFDVSTFNGKDFDANAHFGIKNSFYDLVWNYRFSQKYDENGTEKSYFAALLGVKVSSMKFTIDGYEKSSLGTEEIHDSYSKTFPVPYIGLEFASHIGERLFFKASARYLKLNNIKHYSAEHGDYKAAFSYKLSGPNRSSDLFLDLGYRKVSYKVEGEGNDVKLGHKGPFAGLQLMF